MHKQEMGRNKLEYKMEHFYSGIKIFTFIQKRLYFYLDIVAGILFVEAHLMIYM